MKHKNQSSLHLLFCSFVCLTFEYYIQIVVGGILAAEDEDKVYKDKTAASPYRDGRRDLLAAERPS